MRLGEPVVTTVNDPGMPTMNVAVAGLSIVGGETTADAVVSTA